uniref:endo-1,4-beta-xylanase n=1 Tax=uncultured symbiotic protist of Cryptocercus punctulatus TaxID=403662 RepID=A4UX61_9EUKA|nr:putative glycosyl hydrolase family10 [uncultured symbiotic protist of Cryptocercus punctulatus]
MLALIVLSFSAPIAQGKSKFLGNVIGSSVPSNFGNYWNQVTPENGGKWGSVQSSQNSFNWGDADKAYNWAKSNGAVFKYHTLVWGSQEPGWIGSLSNDAKKQAVTSWINAIKAHFSSIDLIDVVNEALHAPASYREALGGSGSTGWDWIVWSFTQARSAFPGAKLLINEYGVINDSNEARQYIEIINILKSRNLIDGIGIQCHQFNVNSLSAASAKSVLDQLGATGLPIYSSEFDANGNSEADQAAIYQRIFPAIWEHSSVKGVTLWGYITGTTWKDGTGIVEQNGNERQAMAWLKSYIASH